MNRNGNFYYLDKSTLGVVWQSKTTNNPGSYIELTDNGEFVIKNKNDQILKYFFIYNNNKLQNNIQYVDNIPIFIYSINKLFRLEFNNTSGEIIINEDINNKWTQIWTTGTSQTGHYKTLKMNENGNLEIINSVTNAILWQSNTSYNPGAYAELTDNGEFIIKNVSNQIIKTLYAKSTFINKSDFENKIYKKYLEIINY